MKALYYFALIVPAVLGFFALRTRKFRFTAAATYSGIALLLLLFAAKGEFPGNIWWLLLALAVSIGGDWLLSQEGGLVRFTAGIAAFAVAHALFILYAVTGFALPALGWIMAALFVALLLWYAVVRVFPKRENWFMVIPYAVYAALSGLTLGTAFGIGGSFLARLLYVLGALLLVVSDLAICEERFAGNASAKRWVLPLYFAAHIMVTAHAIALVL